MKPLPILPSLIVLATVLIGSANATTMVLPSGPAPKVHKTVDEHLFHVYVTPPKATDDYTPGEIIIMLRKEYPDYLYVSIAHEILADGQMKAQIAISPERVSNYKVNVLDRQPGGEYLMLYSRPLESVELIEINQAEQDGAGQPPARPDSK